MWAVGVKAALYYGEEANGGKLIRGIHAADLDGHRRHDSWRHH